MTTNVTVLPNGIRVASDRMDHLETVSLGVWVSVGARHEREDQHGLSHFLEHMAFKGTATRSARRIAEEIEGVGGELNAATGLDTTAYYARVLKGDEGVALALLADILLNSAFDAGDLNRERDVILQEIAGTVDSPDELAFELLQATSFPGQAIGRPILGTKKSVSGLNGQDMRQYLAEHYRPGAMVVSAAGAVDHEKFVRHVEALFGGLTPLNRGDENAARFAGGAAWSKKPFEQSHLLIGLPSPSVAEPAFYTAQVFSGLFGGGMSSRLFQEIREDRGLCYAIYSSVWGLKDTGMLAVHAACAADMVEPVAALVRQELDIVAGKGPEDAELERSKAQIKAGILIALESASVRAEQMARHLIAFNRLIPMPDIVDQVEAVSQARVKELAAEFAAAPATTVVVGSGRQSEQQAESTLARFAQTSATNAVAAAGRG